MSITVHISGGLGNQLFQYATGRALSLKNGVILYLDTSSFLDQDNTRSYMLQNYFIEANILRKKSLVHQKIANILRSRLSISIDGKVYAEKNNSYDPKVMELGDGVYLLGHWQSEKYFHDYRSTIKQDLSLKTKLSRSSLEVLSEINKTTSVAVHIRRGDYVSNIVAQNVLGTQSLEYYTSTTSYIDSKLKKAHYFVFSDDPIWASQNILKGHKYVTFIPTSAQPYEDFELMRSCDHFIIANSSFSWWAAWLGEEKDSIVIAPKRWFASSEYSSKDLVPKHWIQM